MSDHNENDNHPAPASKSPSGGTKEKMEPVGVEPTPLHLGWRADAALSSELQPQGGAGGHEGSPVANVLTRPQPISNTCAADRRPSAETAAPAPPREWGLHCEAAPGGDQGTGGRGCKPLEPLPCLDRFTTAG